MRAPPTSPSRSRAAAEHVDDPFTLTYRVDGRSVVGDITGRRFTGTFDVTKAEGDCLRNPVRQDPPEGPGPPPRRAAAELPG